MASSLSFLDKLREEGKNAPKTTSSTYNNMCGLEEPKYTHYKTSTWLKHSSTKHGKSHYTPWLRTDVSTTERCLRYSDLLTGASEEFTFYLENGNWIYHDKSNNTYLIFEISKDERTITLTRRDESTHRAITQTTLVPQE